MTLEIDGVTTGYGVITVLRDVSFTVQEGRTLGVLGRNGMGKTTLIRCLSGLIPTTQGTIAFGGKDITGLNAHERARLGMTTVVQGRGIFPRLTVAENLEMGRIASGRPRRNRAGEVLAYFPALAQRMNQTAGTLSGGEQQMLAVGRGLMTEPRLMLLDEPSEGIMPILVQQIGAILADISRAENLTIVIVEQNVPLVFNMTDDCMIVEKGRIVARGTRANVSHSEVMKEYLAI